MTLDASEEGIYAGLMKSEPYRQELFYSEELNLKLAAMVERNLVGNY